MTEVILSLTYQEIWEWKIFVIRLLPNDNIIPRQYEIDSQMYFAHGFESEIA